MKRVLVLFKKSENTADEQEHAVLVDVCKSIFDQTPVTFVDSLKDFIFNLERNGYDLVLFDWRSHRAPTEVVETYYQSPYAANPMIIFFESISLEENAFLREYNIDELAKITEHQLFGGYQKLVELCHNVMNRTSEHIKKRLIEVRFFHSLNNNKVADASEYLCKIEGVLPEAEKAFFHASLLKKKKKFTEALILIKSCKTKNIRLANLLGAIYYQLGEFEKSAHFFELANTKSSRNLRRHFLLYLDYNKLSDSNAKFKSLAMKQLVEIHKISPDYCGVNEKIVSLISSRQSVDNIPLINSILSYANSKEITKIFKKIDTYEEPFRGQFVEKFIRSLSEKANELILNDDITARPCPRVS